MNKLLIDICEDDSSLAEVMGSILIDIGYQTRWSMTGNELDEQMSVRIADALILDVELPGENGFSIAERYHRTYPLLPIIIMSVRGSQKDHLKGYDSGAMLYLPKPFEPEALIACLNGVLAKRKGDLAAIKLDMKNRKLKMDD